MAELWEIEEFEFLKGTFHYEKCQPYRLWYEYLRLSPIYYQAHKERTVKGGLTKAEKKALPDDFDEVRKTYEAFGNVYKYPFRIWWVKVNFGQAKLFGLPTDRLKATPIAYVPGNYTVNSDACKAAIDKYPNSHGFMLLSVPLNGSRAEILRAVSEQLDDDFLQKFKAEYSLQGERFHLETLTTTLRLLLMKARNPSEVLWKLGVEARVSEKYANLDTTVTKIPHHMVEATQVLENITCRMLSHAHLIMENAARGRFPCKDKVALPEMDIAKYRYMWQCVRRRLESNERWARQTMERMTKDPLATYDDDWHDNLLAVDPEFRSRLKELKSEARKRFIEEQLAMHKLGEYFRTKAACGW